MTKLELDKLYLEYIVNAPLTLTGTALGLGTLTTYGTGNYILGANSGATDIEYKRLAQTTNQVIISHAAGVITFSTPQNLGTASAVQFGQIGIGTAVGGANLITLSADGTIGTTGGLTIDLSSASDKTLALINSGAGTANFSTDGDITVGSLLIASAEGMQVPLPASGNTEPVFWVAGQTLFPSGINFNRTGASAGQIDMGWAGTTTHTFVVLGGSAGNETITGVMRANGGFNDNGTAGVDGSFASGDIPSKTVTVSGGIITSIV